MSRTQNTVDPLGVVNLDRHSGGEGFKFQPQTPENFMIEVQRPDGTKARSPVDLFAMVYEQHAERARALPPGGRFTFRDGEGKFIVRRVVK